MEFSECKREIKGIDGSNEVGGSTISNYFPTGLTLTNLIRGSYDFHKYLKADRKLFEKGNCTPYPLKRDLIG